jgi:predicted secreted protein with PEFG-CTERM motif
MHRISYAILTSLILSMGVAPVLAQTPEQFVVKDPQSGQSFPVNYSITGATIDDMSINSQETSIVISLKTTSDGNLTMTLPRALIDAKSGSSDDDFFVLVDGADSDFNETKTNTDRTITVSFPDGTQEMEVIGTQVVPEFGGLSFVVLVIAILSIIGISGVTRIKFTH